MHVHLQRTKQLGAYVEFPMILVGIEGLKHGCSLFEFNMFPRSGETVVAHKSTLPLLVFVERPKAGESNLQVKQPINRFLDPARQV